MGRLWLYANSIKISSFRRVDYYMNLFYYERALSIISYILESGGKCGGKCRYCYIQTCGKSNPSNPRTSVTRYNSTIRELNKGLLSYVERYMY